MSISTLNLYVVDYPCFSFVNLYLNLLSFPRYKLSKVTLKAFGVPNSRYNTIFDFDIGYLPYFTSPSHKDCSCWLWCWSFETLADNNLTSLPELHYLSLTQEQCSHRHTKLVSFLVEESGFWRCRYWNALGTRHLLVEHPCYCCCCCTQAWK